MEVDIDNRKFVVDSINNVFNTVSLKDITFQSGAGFPIFRSESLEWLRLAVKQQKKADTIEKTDTEQPDKDKPLKPDIARTAPTQVKNNVVYPEIPMSERNNFAITDDELGYGGQKEKFRNNMEAIRVLKECEFDNRLATPEEQEILSRYVGWGGLSEAFDETKDNWSKEFQELYSALSPEEYEQARASTLNAHYTSPTVIKAMYKALENMGFKHGNILEPSCGIGNFMGLLPDSMSESKMYGIELDSLTGRIAQQLYQKNSVAIQGYENTSLPDSFFDVAVGNVPFGNYKLADKKYNKHNFFIHDYFFAKTLDKVRPGGIVAFITSMGTMDKKNPSVRKYIAQRADLLGAIRLPNDAFLKNANTQVTADIIFLQKRDRMTDIMPEWVNVGKDENGLTVNQYFIDNPEMVLGEMTEESSQYGKSITCKPYEDADLAQQLDGAIQNIHAQITEYEFDDISNDEDFSIPADPNVKNFSFCVVDGDIYFRENSVMHKVELNSTAENRIKGLIEIRDCVRQLIEYQSEDYPDDDIKAQQEKLNRLYDSFTKKYGLINSRGNSLAFSEDSSYFLLCSLEVIGENGELERKADIFTKRTIGAKKEISKVDTASEALAVSLAEKAKVDMGFMMSLTGKTEDEIVADLKNVIFLNSQYIEGSDLYNKYLTADEYLSGNVRQKLRTAQLIAQNDERYKVNVEALTAVQPKDLTAAEISVKLGSTWIPDKYIEQFTYELLDTPLYAKRQIKVRYYKPTAEWNISKKTFDRTNVKANNTYGTHRANAYKIIEDTLNQRDVRIFDYKENENGNKVAILNVKETAIAQQKQETIKQAFVDWVWKDPERREELVTLYNERFNSNRPREYDGSHITFSGMNPEIKLRQHQKNAVARIMYGGNSLLGHVVGAGKTWTMVAAAMESKRLGLCNKSLFVVPNHLTEQWASEFLQLYPAANILIATKKDFEMKNRKKFCGRIATGDYDAVIIGHSQFEKIPMSAERQIKDGKVYVTLPDKHTLTTSNQTTVTVLNKDGNAVKGVSVTIKDKTTEKTASTDSNGKVTLPVKTSNGGGSSSGGSFGGGGGSYSSYSTVNVKVIDKDGKAVSVTKSVDSKGNVTVTLPTGKVIDSENYYTVTVTDSKGAAKADTTVTLKDRKTGTATGTTDKNGMLTLPATEHKAYIVGYNDGTFKPDSNMSRAEAAAIFARLIAEAKGESISGKASFKDVDKNEWYAGYVGYLEKYDVINGYNDGTFKPDASVTRAEFVAMTVRYYDLFNDVNKTGNTVKYTDVASSYWAYSDIAFAKNIGWLNGYSDGSFRGDNDITRAEVVTVVNRATGRVADKEYVKDNFTKLNRFTDVTDSNMWYFFDVAESCNNHKAVTSANNEVWVK